MCLHRLHLQLLPVWMAQLRCYLQSVRIYLLLSSHRSLCRKQALRGNAARLLLCVSSSFISGLTSGHYCSIRNGTMLMMVHPRRSSMRFGVLVSFLFLLAAPTSSFHAAASSSRGQAHRTSSLRWKQRGGLDAVKLLKVLNDPVDKWCGVTPQKSQSGVEALQLLQRQCIAVLWESQ